MQARSKLGLLLGFALLSSATFAWATAPNRADGARQIRIFQTPEVTVSYDIGLDVAARDVAAVFPAIRDRLEAAFEMEMKTAPGILLVREREDFLKMTRNPLTVAFASPSQNLIVIDQSKMRIHPFTMQSTLEHEMCHILLHQRIDSGRLPRWLDEGLCQWVSNGIDEIITNQKISALHGAALSQRMIPISHLQHRFPGDREARLLAYEASKRFTVFIMSKYGHPRLLDLLNHLAEGEDIQAAVLRAFSASLDSIEQQWQETLDRKSTWFTFFGHYLYELLFVSMALMTIYGFIRSRIKKRNYRDEDDEEGRLGTYQQ